MVNLKKWINRPTTLEFGNVIYEGKVVYGFSCDECRFNSENGKEQKRHYFETKYGKRIPISKNTVAVKKNGDERGLVLKLDS